jgi:protein-S-isoprenylcysteine O-methyltransferase Ste14
MQSISYDILALHQVFLLIFTTVLAHIGATNPNVSSTGDKVLNEGFGSGFGVRFAPNIAKLLIWISTLCQVVYLYLQATSPASIATLFSQIPTSTNLLSLTYISVLGYIFAIIGGLGRIWCFRTLGKFFTFEVTIRSSHKLIKIGPYAYVRHPSYTSAYILTIGIFLVHQRLANLFPNTKWLQILFSPAGFCICCLILALTLNRRVTREEEELKRNFGKEWTEYTSKRKRFIPGVI